jgi:hypothetical protein
MFAMAAEIEIRISRSRSSQSIEIEYSWRALGLTKGAKSACGTLISVKPPGLHLEQGSPRHAAGVYAYS